MSKSVLLVAAAARWAVALLAILLPLSSVSATAQHRYTRFQLGRPYWVDERKGFPSPIEKGEVTVFGFNLDAGGNSGYFKLGSHIAGCSPALYTITYSWKFQPPVNVLDVNQKTNLFLQIQAPECRHIDPWSGVKAADGIIVYERPEEYMSNPEHRYYLFPPKGLLQTPLRSFAIDYDQRPQASFKIWMEGLAVTSIVFPFVAVASPPPVVSVTGTWYREGDRRLPASIQQSGSSLVLINESGGRSRAHMANGSIIADDWGGLVGSFVEGGTRINWGNGSSWHR